MHKMDLYCKGCILSEKGSLNIAVCGLAVKVRLGNQKVSGLIPTRGKKIMGHHCALEVTKALNPRVLQEDCPGNNSTV